MLQCSIVISLFWCNRYTVESKRVRLYLYLIQTFGSADFILSAVNPQVTVICPALFFCLVHILILIKNQVWEIDRENFLCSSAHDDTISECFLSDLLNKLKYQQSAEKEIIVFVNMFN